MMTIRLPLVATLILLATACGGEAPTPAAPTTLSPTPPRPSPSATASAPSEENTLPPVAYDAKGRRDPFAVIDVSGGAKGLTVSSTRLTGIVQSPGGTLALLEAADGIGYILRPGDTLGDGRLVELAADSAVFNVVPRPGAPPTRVTLRLRTDS